MGFYGGFVEVEDRSGFEIGFRNSKGLFNVPEILVMADNFFIAEIAAICVIYQTKNLYS